MDVGLEDIEVILVVDDNPGDVRLIEEAFRASPHDPTIHASKTRDEALTLLNECGESEEVPRPELVFLDWNLSQCTGQEVLQAAEAMEPEIPVIVMTGSKQGLERIKSSAPAADAYIVKQTNPQKYLDVLPLCGSE